MVYIIMGVSGCGKTTVGEALAAHLGVDFHDADGYHPDANRRKMAAGTPLNDLDRAPWLEALAEHIQQWNAAGENQGSAVLACSALKQSYRNVLSRHGGVRFVYLQGSRELIAQRLADRTGHFFPADLLDTQFADLQPPTNAIVVPIDQPINAQVEQIIQTIGETRP
ncbi:MAG: gluconokinase [Phycisphaerales bacterium JB063]